MGNSTCWRERAFISLKEGMKMTTVLNLKKEKHQTHVVVLMGGISAEREVSLMSAEGVAEALQKEGYRVTALDITRDFGHFIRQLETLKPDVVFNALHGRWGEDGCIQGVLEWMKIPYTHSGVLSSALAMNKPLARQIFQEWGLKCPPGLVMTPQEALDQVHFSVPFVIKPIDEGSSVGVHLVLKEDDLKTLDVSSFAERVLVEQYIPGREIQVAVLGSQEDPEGIRAMGAIEICPKTGFYDYRAKYTEGYADHFMPAPLPPEAYEEALEISKKAHQALGCRGVTRVDLRYDDTHLGSDKEIGSFYILELNTQPGMTPLSLVPEILEHRGISFQMLITWLVENAQCM